VASEHGARFLDVSRVLRRVLILNAGVAVAKLIFGYATGAVSIISDGFHSLTDSASNVVALIGIRAARRPPDQDHPYGHRKFETLASAGIFFFLLLVLVEVVRTAVDRLRAGGSPEISTASFALMIGTLAVIAALAGAALGYPLLDPLAAFVVAGFIGHSGWLIARETSQVLADAIVLPPAGVEQVVMSVPGVLGCHHIRTRGSADHAFLDLHVWAARDMRLEDAHALSHVVKDRLLARYPELADVIIHIEPPPAGE
jgi:divalent metal cation (Fe/Co/Zn/Cd) transporter